MPQMFCFIHFVPLNPMLVMSQTNMMMLRFLFLVIYASNVIFNGKFILFCGFRCHTCLFGKAGMYHFLCSGCHDSESEVSRTKMVFCNRYCE